MEANNVGISYRRTNFCCGLQEAGAFHINGNNGTDLTPLAVAKLRQDLDNYPATYCTIVLEYRTTRWDENNNPYDEMLPATDSQGEMARLLPQLGFTPVDKFIGNEGNVVQLWVYIRASSKVEE